MTWTYINEFTLNCSHLSSKTQLWYVLDQNPPNRAIDYLPISTIAGASVGELAV
jgi:hypothetical protein